MRRRSASGLKSKPKFVPFSAVNGVGHVRGIGCKRRNVCRRARRDIDRVEPRCAADGVQQIVGRAEVDPDQRLAGLQTGDCNRRRELRRRIASERSQRHAVQHRVNSAVRRRRGRCRHRRYAGNPVARLRSRHVADEQRAAGREIDRVERCRRAGCRQHCERRIRPDDFEAVHGRGVDAECADVVQRAVVRRILREQPVVLRVDDIQRRGRRCP